MRKFFFCLLTCTFSFATYSACTNFNAEDSAPSKITVFQTDKKHKNFDSNNQIVFNKFQEELSEDEMLYHISHRKMANKNCFLQNSDIDPSYYLMPKSEFIVKSAHMIDGSYELRVEGKNLSHLKCTGIKTLGDLKDVLEPYLTFNCKNLIKVRKEVTANGTVRKTMRAPASADKKLH